MSEASVKEDEEEQRSLEEKSSAQHGTASHDGQTGMRLHLNICRKNRKLKSVKGQKHFYFFGGANGEEIVSSYCCSKGWVRIYDQQRTDFKLKWCETKLPANYYNFREGQQLMYQIPNNNVLTTKIGLLCSLQEYDRVCSKVNHGQGLRRLKMEEFFPHTFRMDIRKEREVFFSQQEGPSCKDQMWICKPTALNQGRGIFILKTQEDIAILKQKLKDQEVSNGQRARRPQAHIVQRYIQKPLLLMGRKFDVRSYLLIACTEPFMVFFRHGYLRLSCENYDTRSDNLATHLTNQYIQKKNPLYSQVKDDTVWSMESFNTYVNEQLSIAEGLPRDWVMGAFTKRMQQIMTQCFYAVKSKLDRKVGYFDLIGCDFLIDEEFKVWLLEMNCNPALHTNCKVLKEVVPLTVVETLDITLEIFKKRCGGRPVLPLASLREFVILYNGASSPPNTASTHEVKCQSPSNQETKPQKLESTTGNQRKSVNKCIGLSSQTLKHNTHSLKPSKPRVELKVSICTWPQVLKPSLTQNPGEDHLNLHTGTR